jgi:hypothetical protein
VPWAAPLVEMTGGIIGHLLTWERHELDGSWWAWVSWVQESGGQRYHKVVQVRSRQPAPAGAARSLPAGAPAATWLRRAQPSRLTDIAHTAVYCGVGRLHTSRGGAFVSELLLHVRRSTAG